MERIEIIKDKLNDLKRLDKGFSIFGSRNHKYELNRTLSEDEILQIETDNSIVLSNEYKLLLRYLGNGGAGCGYGLESLDLKNINPPYIGTTKLLRNCIDPQKIELDMIDLDEISGYVKLFDYGCGMETCLIVNGEEKEGLIFFDCDGRFQKYTNSSLLKLYEDWLDESLELLKRVENKLKELSLQEVIDSEWKLKNFSIKSIVLSLIDAEPIKPGHTGADLEEHMRKQYENWKQVNKKA